MEIGLHALIGGYLEVAYMWPNGDVLYVDEEGLLKRPKYWFDITVRPDQPMAGNGVLVGKEIGDTADTEPPTMTVDELREMDAWTLKFASYWWCEPNLSVNNHPNGAQVAIHDELIFTWMDSVSRLKDDHHDC